MIKYIGVILIVVLFSGSLILSLQKPKDIEGISKHIVDQSIEIDHPYLVNDTTNHYIEFSVDEASKIISMNEFNTDGTLLREKVVIENVTLKEDIIYLKHLPENRYLLVTSYNRYIIKMDGILISQANSDSRSAYYRTRKPYLYTRGETIPNHEGYVLYKYNGAHTQVIESYDESGVLKQSIEYTSQFTDISKLFYLSDGNFLELYDSKLTKLDSSKDVLWHKNYNSKKDVPTRPDYLVNLIETDDGNLVLVGDYGSDDARTYGRLMKIDTQNGEVLWDQQFGGDGGVQDHVMFNSVIENDNELIVSGLTKQSRYYVSKNSLAFRQSPFQEDFDTLFVLKYDKTGKMLGSIVYSYDHTKQLIFDHHYFHEPILKVNDHQINVYGSMTFKNRRSNYYEINYYMLPVNNEDFNDELDDLYFYNKLVSHSSVASFILGMVLIIYLGSFIHLHKNRYSSKSPF